MDVERIAALNAQQRLKGRLRPPNSDKSQQTVDDSPCCVYGLVTRKVLENMQKDVDEIKLRINALILTLGGTVALEVLLRLVGK